MSQFSSIDEQDEINEQLRVQLKLLHSMSSKIRMSLHNPFGHRNDGIQPDLSNERPIETHRNPI